MGAEGKAAAHADEMSRELKRTWTVRAWLSAL